MSLRRELRPCPNAATTFRNARRIVVKVGTSTLTYPNGRLNLDRLERLVRQICDVANEGRRCSSSRPGPSGRG